MKLYGKEPTEQEKRLLGLTEEDIIALVEASTSYEMMFQGILDVLRHSWNTHPDFRALMGRDPKQTTSLVSKFIQYIEGQAGIMVHKDPDATARQVLETIYSEKTDRRMPEPGVVAPEEAKAIPPKHPMTGQTLKSFGLSPAEYTAAISREKVSEGLRAFIAEQGEVLSRADAIDYIYSFLKILKDKKNILVEQGLKKDSGPEFKELFEGSDEDLYERSKVKFDQYMTDFKPLSNRDTLRSDSIEAVRSEMVRIEPMLKNFITDMRGTIRDEILQIQERKRESLPDRKDVKDRVESILGQLSSLGVTREQVPFILDINPKILWNSPMIRDSKDILGNYKILLNKLEKTQSDLKERATLDRAKVEQLRREEASLKETLKEQEARIGVLRSLADKKDDIEKVLGQVDDYLEYLKGFQDKAKDYFSPRSKTSKDMFRGLHLLKPRFSEIRSAVKYLAEQGEFNRLWDGVDKFFGKRASDGEDSSDVDEKAEKLLGALIPDEKSRGDYKLDFFGTLLQKLQSMRLSGVSSPEGTVDEMLKAFDKLQRLYDSFDPTKVYKKLEDTIQNLAKLDEHYIFGRGTDYSIRHTKKKITPKEDKKGEKGTKKVALCDVLRGRAYDLLKEAVHSPKMLSKNIPSYSAKGERRKPNWLVFAKRFKKMGDGASKTEIVNFFDRPTVLNRFLDKVSEEGFLFDIEKEVMSDPNISHMDYPDPKTVAGKLDKKLTEALKDFEGNLEEHVLNQAGVKRATEEGIKKEQDVIKAQNARAKTLSDEVSGIKKTYLPKLNEMAKFLSSPVKYLARRAEEDPDSKRIFEQLDLPKEEMQAIKDEMREESQGRRFVMDRYNYKNTMIKFFQRYIKHKPLEYKVPTGEVITLDDSVIRDSKLAARAAEESGKRLQGILELVDDTYMARENIITKVEGIKGRLDAGGILNNITRFYKLIEESKLYETVLSRDWESLDELKGFLKENEQKYPDAKFKQNEDLQTFISRVIETKKKEAETHNKEILRLYSELAAISPKISEIDKKLASLLEQYKTEIQSGKRASELNKLMVGKNYLEKKMKADETAGRPVSDSDWKKLEELEKGIESLKKPAATIDVSDIHKAKKDLGEIEDLLKKPLDFDRKLPDQLQREREDFIEPPAKSMDPSEIKKLEEEYWSKREIQKDKPYKPTVPIVPTEKTKKEFDDFIKGLGQSKTAAFEDSMGGAPMSTHDVIETTVPDDTASKGKPFPVSMKEWDVFEHLFQKDIDRLRAYKDQMEKGGIPKDMLKDVYKQVASLSSKIFQKFDRVKTPITIAGERLKIPEVAGRFNAIFDEYQTRLNKNMYQMEDALEMVREARAQLRAHHEYINPETGEFLEMTPEEKRKIIGYYMEQLYKELDEKWTTAVGTNALFGRKEGPKYEIMFNTLKNLGAVRSNRLLMNQLSDLKQVLRSKFMEYRKYKDREEELEAEIERTEGLYKDVGEDPSHLIKEMKDEIETLKNQKILKEKIFRRMLDAISLEERANILQGVYQIGVNKGDLDEDSKKEMEEQVDKLREEAQKNLTELVKNPEIKKDLAELKTDASKNKDQTAPNLKAEVSDTEVENGIKDMLSELTKKSKPYEEELIQGIELRKQKREEAQKSLGQKQKPSKESYTDYRKDPNFNAKLLYGSLMQETILKMALKRD